MKFEEKDVLRLSRNKIGTEWVDVLQHVPSGITCSGFGDYSRSYYRALASLSHNVNAYYAAAAYCEPKWAAPGIERITKQPESRESASLRKDPVWQLLMAHSVGKDRHGDYFVDFDSLRRAICEMYNVRRY